MEMPVQSQSERGEPRKKRILVIAPKYFPCDHSFLENVFADAFAEFGFKVYFILYARGFSFPLGMDQWKGNTVFTRPSFNKEGPMVRWVNSILVRINVLTVPLVIQKVKPDFIFVRTELLTCLVAKAFVFLGWKKCRVYYHYNWPLYENEYLEPLERNGIYGIYKHMERMVQKRLLALVFKKADHIFSISSSMMQKLIMEGRIEEGRVSALPLAAREIDGLPYKSVDWRQSVRQAFRLEDKFVVIYVGSLSDIRERSLFLEIAKCGRTLIGNKFHFMIIGAESDSQKDALLRGAKENLLSDCVTILKRVPRERIPEFLCSADVGISPIPPTPFFEISSPTKIYEYMAAGRPFVSSRIREVEAILEKAQAGLLSNHSAMDYALAVKRLYDDETLRDKCEKEGLRFTKDIHNYRTLSRAFLRQIMADESEGNYPASAHL